LNPGHAEPKLSKKARQRKGEYLRKLEEDNKQLKDTILQFEQKIATIQAQNEILSQQLQFFQGYLAGGTAPPGETEKA
jgi:vacuolar-type H+-ATPase subunit H